VAAEHELGIEELYQGVKDKGSLCAELMDRKMLAKEQVCCIGDDLPDIPMFNRVGMPVAVADAVPEVRDAAGFVTKSRGGKGAVREICELILESQGRWSNIISTFTDR